MRRLPVGRVCARLRAIARAAPLFATLALAPGAAVAGDTALRLIPEPSAKLAFASGAVLLAALHAQRRRRAQRERRA
jgi:hypothetical protein